MPDLGPLLERELQEIRPAGYTIADVARRRERRSRNRRIGASAVALVIAVATIGGFVLAFRHVPSTMPARQPSATPSVSTAPSVVTLAESACPDYSCEGPLEPGRYRATYYDTTIAFEIASPGWRWTYTGNFVIEAAPAEGKYSADGIYFFLDPAIASHDCEDAAEPGVGRSADELAAWLEAAPGLAASDPTPVTVGGLRGVRLDLQLDPAWKKTCFYSDGQPTVPLIFSGADIGGYNWGIGGLEQSMRWYILDSDQGAIIVDIEDNPGGLSRDDLIRTGSGIVDSLAFSPSS
jgi:hypothetical protein